MKDPIERQEVMDAIYKCTDVYVNNLPIMIYKAELYKAILELPPAEPEMNFDEWCTDCKEYDQERHCCPRFNRVIRNALKDAQPERKWIPVSERLPEVAHSVLFSRRSMDTREGCLQADGKWWQYRWNEILNVDQVTAWPPLPEPYAERRTDE